MSQTPTSSPDPSWKGLPSWLVYTLLIIGPPAALITFTKTLIQKPLLFALIIVGYEVLLFLIRLIGRIWQPLEDSLVRQATQWLTIRTQEIISRYYRSYCKYLIYEHQIFDVKGLSTRTAHDLELEQIFVDLSVEPLPPHQASANPLQTYIPETLQGTHSIWSYLSAPTLANTHLVILGAPGSGKTTLLKHIALTLAQPLKYSHRIKQHKFPILLFLRDHIHTIEQPDFTLAKAVQDHIQLKWQQTISLSWIKKQLESGKCLVLLDGLDEVPNATTRQQIVTWIQRQFIAYPQNRFIVTSRPYGYRDNPLEGVTVLDVQPFTRRQVEQFVQNWYLANELKNWGKDDPGVHLRAHEGTRDILQRLRQVPTLLALTVNPLLLTMIATVHRYRSSLPGKRVELYKEICEVFLGKRHEAQGISHELSPAQKQQVLQPLAYYLMQQGLREITSSEAQREIAPALALVNSSMSPVEFLQYIENSSGLLLERNPGIYGFAHKTFQEYLTAVHIKEEGLEQVLVKQVANDWWHETIRLYCAQADATTLIQACLQGNPPRINELVLAFECDDEKLKIQPSAQAELNQILKTGGEDPDPERRRVIGEALLTRRLRHMFYLYDETYIDTKLITCTEYQVFLDEQRMQGKYFQPEQWSDFSFPIGTGQTALLGIRQSDAIAFCNWLTLRDREGWRYRLPRINEQPPKEIDGLNTLKPTTGHWIEEAPFFSCTEKKPLTFLKDSFFRSFFHDSISIIDLDRALYIIHDNNIVHLLDHTVALDLDRTITLIHDYIRDHAHDRTFDYTLNHTINQTHNHIIADALPLPFDLALDRTLNRTITLTRPFVRTGPRPFARTDALTLALDLTLALALPTTNIRASNITIDGNRYSGRYLALALYVILSLLQARLDGKLQACEGILLVKERIQESRQ